MANSWNESGTLWGIGNWGQQSNTTVTLTGIGLTSSMGDETATGTIEKGWGRGSWGNRVWGDTYSVLPTGVSTTSSIGDVSVVAGAIVSPTGTSATISLGDVDLS